MKPKPIHYKSVWEHCEPKHHDASQEEDFKECLRKILTEEIYNSRYWCLSFAQMGSKKCQRIADEKGWHKGPWKVEKPQASAKTKAEKQREKSRAYRAAHREELNAKAREYRAMLRADKEGEIKQDLQKRKACLAEIEERKQLKKERQKAYQKKWAATHKDKVREYCRNYYERHQEEIKAKYLQRYYANHDEELKVRALRRYYKRKEAEQNELARLVHAGTGTTGTGVVQLGVPDCCGDCQQVTG